MKKSEITRQGLDDVSFIGNENEPRLIEKLDYSTAIAVGPGPPGWFRGRATDRTAHGSAQNPDG